MNSDEAMAGSDMPGGLVGGQAVQLPLWLETLNPQQRAAATAGDEPLLIIAGAGTGKTSTLAHRVAWLIHRGISPERILLLTFTRRAAHEMTRRVEGILTKAAGANGAGAKGAGIRGGSAGAVTPVSRIWSGTFHSIANRILRIHAEAIGLGEAFTVIDRSDAEDLLNVVRSELALDRGDVRFPRKGTAMAIYSRCVNAQEPVEAALRSHFPWCAQYPDQLKALFRAYTQRKHDNNVLDYDDLLLYWSGLMDDPAAAADLRRRFDAVLVDEYQDTNALQASVLERLCPSGRGLTVVGDDAQSIYSFRAATVNNILKFPQQFPGAAVLKLEQNYRSVQPILDATNAVIALCPRRYNKDLFSTRSSSEKPRLVTVVDEQQQCDYLISRVLAHHEEGIPLRRQAVLFRAAHHSDALEIELSRRNIPFVKYGGLKFLEAAHVKDVLSFLRLAENPRDTVAAQRVLLLLDGVGPSAAKKAMEHLAARRFDFKAWENFPAPAAAMAQWPGMVSMLIKLAGDEHRTGALPLRDQVAEVNQFYSPILDRLYDQAPARRRDLDQLEQIAAGFTSRSQMLTDLTLDPPASTQDLAGPPLMEEDYLILSTIHSAKGCEWDAAYVIHAADGNIPSDMATGSEDDIEEERRLFYVALTRAKDFLEVVFPLRYYARKRGTSDRHSYAQLTRFIPPALLPHFNRITLEAPPDAATPKPSVETTVNIRKKISALWA